jgi:hypothetical protein
LAFFNFLANFWYKINYCIVVSQKFPYLKTNFRFLFQFSISSLISRPSLRRVRFLLWPHHARHLVN